MFWPQRPWRGDVIALAVVALAMLAFVVWTWV